MGALGGGHVVPHPKEPSMKHPYRKPVLRKLGLLRRLTRFTF
jgi:hypothetical protein